MRTGGNFSLETKEKSEENEEPGPFYNASLSEVCVRTVSDGSDTHVALNKHSTMPIAFPV